MEKSYNCGTNLSAGKSYSCSTDRNAEKIACLISTGIDSAVAVHMLMKKYEPVLVYFDVSSGNSLMNLEKIRNKLGKGKEIKLYVVPYREILENLRKAEKLTCVVCKRTMYRIANKIAENEKAIGIATGESLGQVASQTLANLVSLTKASSLPVLRPLLGLDKQEIVEIARKIGTYDLFLQKEKESCFAVPKYPATRSYIDEIEQIEKKIGVEKIITEAMEKVKIY